MAVRYAALSRKVHVCHCNSLGGATWRSVMITGRTDKQTDRVRRNMRPPPREEGRIKRKNNDNLTKLNYYNIHSTISPRNQQNEVLQNKIHYHTGDSWPQISYYVVQSIRSAMQSWTECGSSLLHQYYLSETISLKNRLTTKSNELLSDLRNGHASKLYSENEYSLNAVKAGVMWP